MVVRRPSFLDPLPLSHTLPFANILCNVYCVHQINSNAALAPEPSCGTPQYRSLTSVTVTPHIMIILSGTLVIVPLIGRCTSVSTAEGGTTPPLCKSIHASTSMDQIQKKLGECGALNSTHCLFVSMYRLSKAIEKANEN